MWIHPSIQHDASGQGEQPNQHPKSYLARLLAPENLPNIPLVIAGFVGLYIARRTLNTVEQQTAASITASNAAKSPAKTAVDDLVLSSRAWISARSRQAELRIGSPLLGIVDLTNSGNTPAVNIRALHSSVLAIGGEVCNLAFPDEGFSKGKALIMPGGQIAKVTNILGAGISTSPATPDGLVNQKIIDSLRGGQRFGIMYGRVEYSDIFGRCHFTDYCMRLKVMPPVTAGGPDTLAWELCEVGNGIDLYAKEADNASEEALQQKADTSKLLTRSSA